MDREVIYGPEGYYKNSREEGYPIEYVNIAIRDKNILESTATKLTKEGKLILSISDSIIGEINKEDFEIYDSMNEKAGYMYSKVGLKVKYVPLSMETKGDISVVKCSRKLAQEKCKAEYLDSLKPGDVVSVGLMNIYRNSIFCDVGCGVAAIIPFSSYCVPKIKDITKEMIGTKYLKAVVSKFDDKGRITLSHKELIGTWKESLEGINEGDIVTGYVNDIDKHGIWVLLNTNVIALTESTLPLSVGDKVSVYVKSIQPETMKIKIAVNQVIDRDNTGCMKPAYRIKYGHIDYWKYSTDECKTKVIESRFDNVV